MTEKVEPLLGVLPLWNLLFLVWRRFHGKESSPLEAIRELG